MKRYFISHDNGLFVYVDVYLLKIEHARKPEGPISMKPINMEEDSSLPPELLKLWTEVAHLFTMTYFL